MLRRLALACVPILAGCGARGEQRLPSTAISASATKDTRDRAEPVASGPLARSERALGVGLSSPRHFSLSIEEIADVYALEATAAAPEWSAPSSDAQLSRDDDLLSAWTCSPNGEANCAIGLSFPEPVELRALRLFAAAGPDWKTYAAHSRLDQVRVHTDEGEAKTAITDGAGHRYIVFAEPVTTHSVTLEVLSTQGGGGPIHVAEVEALGPSGVARAPIELDPQRAYVNYVNSDWKQNESGDFIVRQAFLEFDRREAEPLRLMRATAMFGSPGDRFLLIERLYKTDCGVHGGSYVLLDTQRRTYFPIGTMGGVPAQVFVHLQGFGFAFGHGDLRDLASAVFTGTSVERKRFPKRSRDSPTDYLDAWSMDPTVLERGGRGLDSPPANCGAVEDAERSRVAETIAAGEDDIVLHCNLERGAAIVGRNGFAVVDERGETVASQRLEDPGPYEPRLRAVGLGRDEADVELFVETRDRAGFGRVFRLHAGGIAPMAEDTSLALRPPHECDRAGDFGTVRRPLAPAPGAEPTPVPAG